jgi:hypothetical protein
MKTGLLLDSTLRRYYWVRQQLNVYQSCMSEWLTSEVPYHYIGPSTLDICVLSKLFLLCFDITCNIIIYNNVNVIYFINYLFGKTIPSGE